MEAPDEHTLEFLLAFDGREHLLRQGYWLEIRDQAHQANSGTTAWSAVFVHVARSGRRTLDRIR